MQTAQPGPLKRSVESEPRPGLLPVLFAALFTIALGILVWLTFRFEASEAQAKLERESAEVVLAIRSRLTRDLQAVQLMADAAPGLAPAAQNSLLRERAANLLTSQREVAMIEWRDPNARPLGSVTSPTAPAGIGDLLAGPMSHESTLAFSSALRLKTPEYSSAHYLPLPDYRGMEVMHLWVPVLRAGKVVLMLGVIIPMPAILTELVPIEFASNHEISLTESDGSHLARRVALGRGRGVYKAVSLVDLPGTTMLLQTNSLQGGPKLIPNLLTGLVITLSVTLLISLVLLARDIRQRLAAERALREQYAFRKAMEDSLVTGLRARDDKGRITYVNPAFCQMVGFDASELVGMTAPMAYWAPEVMDEYQRRFSQVLDGTVTRAGFETVFMRRNGERFTALIFESPLLDAAGRQTGWMSSILDITEQKRIESLNRQQQEQLQVSARLATMGELASALSHELNQPLSAISSFASGSINMIDAGKVSMEELKRAMQTVLAQAQRAGHVIRSVHDFVRRRTPLREQLQLGQLVGDMMPLVRLRMQGTGVEVDVTVQPDLPWVEGDRVMIEQVLLNLARNGIDAMQDCPRTQRSLQITVERAPAGEGVDVRVAGWGPGISPGVAERLFTPFFTTKSDGMGMGLNICRTVVEQHGGRLWHEPREGGGTVFCVSLPATTQTDDQAALPQATREPVMDTVEQA